MIATIVRINGSVARIHDGARLVAEWSLEARQVRTPAREAATLRAIARSFAV